MPTRVQAPNGQIIEFPDSMDQAAILNVMHSKFGEPQKTTQDISEDTRPVGTAEDIARAIPGHLRKGIEGIIGTPGEISSGVEWVGKKLNEALGYGPQESQAHARAATASASPMMAAPYLASMLWGGEGPVTSDVVHKRGNETFGEPYKPQTTPGEYAATVSEFIPGALVGGGGGTTKEALKSALKYGVAPAITSETAGQVTKGTTAEPYARLAGALASPVLGKITAKAIEPWTSKEAQQLIEQGVPLTFGQSTNKFLKSVEEKAESLPISGFAIRGAQKRANEGFQRVAANKVLEPIGKRISEDVPVGEALIREVGDKISDFYDNTLAGVSVKQDGKLLADIKAIKARVRPDVADNFDHYVSRLVDQSVNPITGNITGHKLKSAISSLRDLTRKLGKNPQVPEQELGSALGEVQDALTSLIARQASPEIVGKLKQADTAWANLIRVERAAANTADAGKFTPAQLQSAVKTVDPSTRRRSFARGKSLMQDLSGPAKRVMTREVPNSGTPERQMLDKLITAGAYGGSAYTGYLPALLGTEAGLSLMYTKKGQDLLRALTSGAPKKREAIGNALRKATAGESGATPLMEQFKSGRLSDATRASLISALRNMSQ